MSQIRKYFGTDGIRGRAGLYPIIPEFALKLGWAIGQVLLQNSEQTKILIGKDTRLSGDILEAALTAGLVTAGVSVQALTCPLPTPAIAHLTRTLPVQAGIVISASHNPYHDNGIKLFSATGTKLADGIEQAIEAQLQSKITLSSYSTNMTRVNDAADHYVTFCKSTVPPQFSLQGLKIVLDCANGATYRVAPRVFSELGANVITLGVQPNGYNINANCGSNHPQVLQASVISSRADLGIVFDGDGDRVLMVDHTGAILDGDELLYILAKTGLASGRVQGGVVGTVMSNLGLELALRHLGLTFQRAPVGDRHVNGLLQQMGWQLGGETSGHIICRDITSTGDGIITALQVLVALDQHRVSLHDCKAGIEKFPQKLINVCARRPQSVLTCAKVRKATDLAEKELAGMGRILLRPSGTEPLIRVMVEGSDSIQISRIAKQLAAIVAASAS